MRSFLKIIHAILIFNSCLAFAQASTLSADLHGKIDDIVQQSLHATGAPSASIAIVTDGKISYLQAYGNARLEPATPARPDMRYSIGSISKQFTAAAMLLLVEQGKLSLDDPVSRFLPKLTRANEVTIRQILSHTSGYQDYWPQDYVPPFMLQPITADKILDQWGRKPLDFDPGTDWQYSNTGFVIAGQIVEKASGTPLLEFLRKNIFIPLNMQSVIDINHSTADPTGYMRYGLGPLHPAPKEGTNWLFAAGELAMPAQDLAKWDISIMNQSVLKPASYKEMERNTLLKNGLASDYGLGVFVHWWGDHHMIEHDGEVSGFTAENIVFPDDRIAVVVQVNQDAINVGSDIARKIVPLLLPHEDTSNEEQKARRIFGQLQQGKIDRSLFSENANSYFTQQALQDFASSLGPLGTPTDFAQTSRQERGGMTFRAFRVSLGGKAVEVWQRTLPDGKIEQYQIMSRD